ncbi:MAG: DUF4917 family protein [Bdellovibrionota bacterium]
MTFENVRQIIQNRESNLIFGNGFSKKLSEVALSYTNLMHFAKSEIDKNSILKLFFERLGSSDFELIHEYLTACAKTQQVFYQPGEFNNFDFSNAKRALNHIFCEAIKSAHPGKGDTEIFSDIDWQRVADYFQCFNNIFTTNYDLFSYWALVELTHKKLYKYFDGFSYWMMKNKEKLAWGYYQNEQNFHFLHGALMLIPEPGGRLYKLKSQYRCGGDSLLNLIQQSINQNKWPLFISDGDGSNKLSRIRNYEYLNHCYEKLENAGGSLTTLGISFDRDDHLVSAINKSKIDTIFIGVFNGDKTYLNKMTSLFDKKHCFAYCTESVDFKNLIMPNKCKLNQF